MTTLDTRPKLRAVIDGEATENTNPHRFSMWAATGCIPIGAAGLVYTSLQQPELVAWPIGVTFATAVTAAVQALRHDLWLVKR